MGATLFGVAASLYAAACLAYFANLNAQGIAIRRVATIALAVAAAVHAAQIGYAATTEGLTPFGGVHQALSDLSLLIVVAYLALVLKGGRAPVDVLGAFVTPITLFLLLSARYVGAGQSMPPRLRGVLLPVHIAVNVLGLAAFAIAFVVAVAYLIQEYQIKQKRLGGPFRRLPPLDLLDSVGVASVTIGFPLLTIGIVSGVVFARRMAEQSWSPSAQQTLAFVAWIVFAAVLVLRVAVGWRGRRAAIGTILGFASSVTVLVVYLVRTAPPV